MKRVRPFLQHILTAISHIEEDIAPGEAAFLGERMRQNSVVRELEIIGEAVKHLSPELRRQRPEIPWRKFAGLRDKLIHMYWGVSTPLVWRIAQNDLPALRVAIEALLGTLDPDLWE